ncbi:MAG TPA: hypothetical protein PKA28_07635 [Methylomusa anaerophila]|uniref:Uncharacterized protein n=1 Tax=Methylomusa anaerophila TaxID=1930071 RepID=A0A348AFX2_9FIRM|nr:hypothetical protein [Methylomusa anaerophila]BBB89970.1 hypothetical protein MAMMFC1_00611 [Methylomusa anaerophila]HML88303.1 hypothetical protein [Methylomusa anaerophila]
MSYCDECVRRQIKADQASMHEGMHAENGESQEVAPEIKNNGNVEGGQPMGR